LKFVIEEDITNSVQYTTLFREDGHVTNIIISYLLMHGAVYLSTTLEEILATILQKKKNCNVKKNFV
jgi:hypothetical protein